MNAVLPSECEAILIGCGSEKRAVPSRAEEVYTSRYFAAKRNFAISTGLPWAILSAQFGVLQASTIIQPYNKTLGGCSKWERREWAAGVALQIFEWQRYLRCVAIIAGEAYVSPLAATLLALEVTTVLPCKGLGIGEQIAWLKTNTPSRGQLVEWRP